MWSFDRTAPAPTIEFAHRQKPLVRGFTPAPVAGDPRYLDVFAPLRVRKPLPVETERHAFAYVFEGSGTFSSASQPFGILTEVAHAAATTSRHACMAEALKARCVLVEVRWRWTLKVFCVAACTERNLCADPTLLNPCIFLSLRRDG